MRRKLSETELAKRAQRLADVLHELKEKREAFKKVRAGWTAKLKRLEEEAEMLGEAVRLKSDESEQAELPLGSGGEGSDMQ